MSVQHLNALSSAFVDQLCEELSNGQTDEAIALIHDEKYSQCLKDTSWDVIPVIAKYLNNETVTKSPELFKCCKVLLEEIASKAYEEETMLELLVEAQALDNDVKFLTMLQPLQIVLFRLSSRRSLSFQYCFNVIKKHIKALPVHQKVHCEDGVMAVNTAMCVQRIKNLYVGIIPFYKPIVCKVLGQHSASVEDDLVAQRNVLICFILQLLGRPFAYLECGDDPFVCSLRSAAEEMLSCLCRLVRNIMMFMEFTEEEETDDQDDDLFILRKACDSEIDDLDKKIRENEVSVLCIAVLYYLVLSKEIQLESVPCVYHPVFVFRSCLSLACSLLKKVENMALHKGLQLTQAVLARLSDKDLTAAEFSLPIHCNFIKILINVMTYCKIKTSRLLAINLFKSYLFKFDLKGRYMLLWNVHRSVKYTSVRGFLITQLKDIIRMTMDENEVSVYFTGKCLCDLVSMYCNVPQKPKTDMLDIVDEVMSALNLIRFMAIKDQGNKTGIWDYLKSLEVHVFKDLIGSLKYSRDHYNELAKLEEKKKDVNKSEERLCVTVGDEELTDTSQDGVMLQVDYVRNAFDMIENLLARVKECLALSDFMKLLHLGREYPQGYDYFRTRLKRVFMKNRYVTDPSKIETMIAHGQYVVKELEALYMLRKYRTLKRRYYADP